MWPICSKQGVIRDQVTPPFRCVRDVITDFPVEVSGRARSDFRQGHSVTSAAKAKLQKAIWRHNHAQDLH